MCRGRFASYQRPKDAGALVIGADAAGIEASSIDHEVTHYSWNDLRYFDTKYSTDRVNWKPCTKLA